MTDIHATAYRYDAVCTELGIDPQPYIVTMFEREKEEAVLKGDSRKERDYKDSMDLYLAGNNELLCTERIEDPQCEALYKTLENNMYVRGLDLRYNRITDDGATFIAKLIEETATLVELNLMCNDIGATGAECIARALHKNESLVSLKMNGNKIGNKGGMYFAQMLQINTTLKEIDLGDTDMTIEAVIALSTTLHHNRTLQVLTINRPLLFTQEEEPTVHFANMLKVNTTLLELHMQKYEIRDFGATRLAENLMENFTLTHIDLSCNRITRDGAKELAKVLKKNTAIKVLDLGYNRLEDDGALHLADALTTYNTTLEILVVVYNNIGGKGLCALADCLKVNSIIQSVHIWGNKLEESACIAFANLMESGRLEKENADVQPYVVDGVTILSELNHGLHRHYYYTPSYGGDVPSWQPRGKNPRGSDVIAYNMDGNMLTV